MFIAPRYTRLLDKLFASPAKPGAEDSDLFGAFKIDPKRPLEALAEAYGPVLAQNLPMDQSIADFMRERLGGQAEVGDRVACGKIDLIVREADADGNVIEAGLSVSPDMSPRIPLFLSGRQILDMIKAKLSRKRRD
jgi:cell volume regulation protein A